MEIGFRKSLKLKDSTAIVIGSMIGSGIFIVSADMSRILGSPGWLLVAWGITALMTIFAALSYGELASMMPNAGGQYIYLREAYNPLSGFLYGWTLFMVIQTGTIAAVGMAFAKFFGVFAPWFSENNVLIQVFGLKINTVQLLAIASIVILTWNNTLGIKAGKWVQNIFTLSKLLVFIGFLVLGLFFARNLEVVKINASIFWDAHGTLGDFTGPLTGFVLVAALGTALVGSLFSSDAWNNITFAGDEIVNPKRTIPRSLILGTLIVSILYLLANWVYINVLPLRGQPDGVDAISRGIQYATNDRLGTATMSVIFGDYAAVIMAVFIVISTFGCNNGLILAGARVYYTMAKDGLFFNTAGKLNKYGVPANGLIFQGIWASLLCLSGKYHQLLDYVVFAVLIFYVLTILGIFILRIKKPEAERPYKAFGYPVIPALYIIMAMFVMVVLLIYKPMYTWPGLIIVLLGFPVYFLRKKSIKTR